MNALKGHITTLTIDGGLALVQVGIGEATLSLILIDTPQTADYLESGTTVQVLFKSTEVVIAKQLQAISIQNQWSGKITAMESGTMMTRLVLNTTIGELSAIVMTAVIGSMELEVGSPIVAMVKADAIMLSS